MTGTSARTIQSKPVMVGPSGADGGQRARRGRVGPRAAPSRRGPGAGRARPAVKPHTTMPRTSNAGPIQPLGCSDAEPVGRVGELGERHAVDGRDLERVDRAHGRRRAPPAQHGGHDEAGRGQPQRAAASRRPRRPTGRGRSPRAASRSAAPTASASPGSTAPPGNAGCPAWERMSGARSIRSRSGPSAPSPSRMRTAASRPPSSGGRNRVRSSPPDVDAAASASGCEPGREHRQSLTGGLLSSRCALTGSVSPTPKDGHQCATGQAPHAGVRARQQRRPWKITRCDEHRPLLAREQARRSRARP